MALMLGQLYDALRAGNVPDDKARAAAEEVANYEGELTKLRLEMASASAAWRASCAASMDDRLPDRARPRVFALQWQILLRLPS